MSCCCVHCSVHENEQLRTQKLNSPPERLTVKALTVLRATRAAVRMAKDRDMMLESDERGEREE
jgi:hypothetical protein